MKTLNSVYFISSNQVKMSIQNQKNVKHGGVPAIPLWKAKAGWQASGEPVLAKLCSHPQNKTEQT